MPRLPKGRGGRQGLLTILFTDIESSVRATQRLGDDKAQEMVHVHNLLVRRALSLNGGTEVKHTGDGIMATFPSARRAVACAIAIQEASRSHNESHRESAFNIRIGLNAGEPVSEDEDVFGTAVQLAARVCARAEPGTILASDVVRQLVAGKGILFDDVGPVELKGFEESFRLYEIRAEAGAGPQLLEGRGAQLRRLLAHRPLLVAGGVSAVGVAVVVAAALLLLAGDGQDPTGTEGAVAGSIAPSPGAPTTESAEPELTLTAAEAQDIRDLVDRYNAKSIEASRTGSLAGLDAIAIGDAFTQLARTVDGLKSRGVRLESTRESIDVGEPMRTGDDTASAGTVEIWTNCGYRVDNNELVNAERSIYEEKYSFALSGGRWYVERVMVTTVSSDPFDGCQSCQALRQGCEAVVTNVAPLNLFVRQAPDRDGSVAGRLPEGTKVCLTGTAGVADGLTWWPLRATVASGTITGWSADHEPNPPNAPLLSPTGLRCE